MRSWDLERIAPLSGVVFVILLVAGAILIGNFEFLPPGDGLVAFYESNRTAIFVGSYLGILSAFFLIVFAASVASRLRRASAGGDLLGALGLAGGVAAGLCVLVAYATMLVTAERAGATGGLPAATAIGLHDFASNLVGTGAAVSFAVIVGAVGVAALRDALLPSWAGWLSVALAIGLLSPVGWAVLALVIGWAPLVGLALYRDTQTGSGIVANEPSRGSPRAVAS